MRRPLRRGGAWARRHVRGADRRRRADAPSRRASSARVQTAAWSRSLSPSSRALRRPVHPPEANSPVGGSSSLERLPELWEPSVRVASAPRPAEDSPGAGDSVGGASARPGSRVDPLLRLALPKRSRARSIAASRSVQPAGLALSSDCRDTPAAGSSWVARTPASRTLRIVGALSQSVTTCSLSRSPLAVGWSKVERKVAVGGAGRARRWETKPGSAAQLGRPMAIIVTPPHLSVGEVLVPGPLRRATAPRGRARAVAAVASARIRGARAERTGEGAGGTSRSCPMVRTSRSRPPALGADAGDRADGQGARNSAVRSAGTISIPSAAGRRRSSRRPGRPSRPPSWAARAPHGCVAAAGRRPRRARRRAGAHRARRGRPRRR